jgi:hypothetical protein
VAHKAEGTADDLTFDEELLLWLGDEPPGVRAADAERIRDIAGESFSHAQYKPAANSAALPDGAGTVAV